MEKGCDASEKATAAVRVRYRLTVTGIVQGVGFRPFVYGLALANKLGGFVGNNSRGVFIEIEGKPEAVSVFQQELVEHPPPLAHIEEVTAEALNAIGEFAFKIVRSETQATENTLISPDICVCDDCFRELMDPLNRRYGYPFINCTNCGPRFSIIKDIPYDRPLTTMADFPMCPECLEEYENPLDRRFHAQPNACAECGPHVWLEYKENSEGQLPEVMAKGSESDVTLGTVQQLLGAGKIVAVKGLGGFHLACNAMDDRALQTLRERKGRVDKPFAVMARDLATLRSFAEISVAEERLLLSKERPIVLLRKKTPSLLSALVAPGNQFVGAMLPYTPLHYLLFADWLKESDTQDSDSVIKLRNDVQPGRQAHENLAVLVMTSGNYSDEPIVKDNSEARERLGHLADAFLFHNRDIHARCDDSVVRIASISSVDSVSSAKKSGAQDKVEILLPIRRSRGYAPFPVKLAHDVTPTLAVGGELKATFCLAKGQYGYMSQHIGDMENLETLEAFTAAVDHFEHIFRTEPELIACDLHPRYLSTRWAEQHENNLPIIQTQHHHAHIASVMAEHQLDGSHPVIGFSFDGTGYGTDGAVWGGEALLADYHGFERLAFLKYVPLLGGDAAVKRPYRIALAHLRAAGIDWNDRIPSVQACSSVELNVLKKQLETGVNAVPTSSMGRLFDAVASLVGIRQTVSFEAQAAIELESLATQNDCGSYTFVIDGGQFDAAPVIEAVVQDFLSGTDSAVISARFHRAVAELVLGISQDFSQQTGISSIALSGGVFQNVTLLGLTIELLQEAGFTIYSHRLVPPNDGGLALGQVAIATASH